MKSCLNVNAWHRVAHPRQGRWAKVPLSRETYTSQSNKPQFYNLLSYCTPGLLQQQTQWKQRDWLSKGNQIIISELLFLKKCILPFPPFSNKEPQPGWQCHLPCTAIVTLPGLTAGESLQSLTGFCSSEFRGQIHPTDLFYIFSLPSIHHMQEKCSGGSKYGDILSYLSRNNSYTYFHYISGGVRTKINNYHLFWPILPFSFFFFFNKVSSLREQEIKLLGLLHKFSGMKDITKMVSFPLKSSHFTISVYTSDHFLPGNE